jgi:hypothetical protein
VRKLCTFLSPIADPNWSDQDLSPRRFSPPWSVEDIGAAFVVTVGGSGRGVPTSKTAASSHSLRLAQGLDVRGLINQPFGTSKQGSAQAIILSCAAMNEARMTIADAIAIAFLLFSLIAVIIIVRRPRQDDEE